MKKETMQYSLQLRPVEMSSESRHGVSELEVIVFPAGSGKVMKARFRQWEPIFERICSIISSSPFHRKAMHRTLKAGLPTHLINRSTGDKHLFSQEQIAELNLELSASDELNPAA